MSGWWISFAVTILGLLGIVYLLLPPSRAGVAEQRQRFMITPADDEGGVQIASVKAEDHPGGADPSRE